MKVAHIGLPEIILINKCLDFVTGPITEGRKHQKAHRAPFLIFNEDLQAQHSYLLSIDYTLFFGICTSSALFLPLK